MGTWCTRCQATHRCSKELTGTSGIQEIAVAAKYPESSKNK